METKRFKILLESKLGNLRPITEQDTSSKDEIREKVKTNKQNIITYYTNWFSKEETKKKFKDQTNISKLLSYLNTIKIKLYWNDKESPYPTSNGWVMRNVEGVVNLNMYKLTKGNQMYNTMLHEMGHLIDFYLQKLGESTVTVSTEGFYDVEGGMDSYVASESETITRIQRLRNILGIQPLDSGLVFADKIFSEIKNGNLTFGNYIVQKTNDKKYLVLSKPKKEKGTLQDLWTFYGVLKFKNQKQSDIAALFANFSMIKDNKVYLNLFKIGQINLNTKGIQ